MRYAIDHSVVQAIVAVMTPRGSQCWLELYKSYAIDHSVVQAIVRLLCIERLQAILTLGKSWHLSHSPYFATCVSHFLSSNSPFETTQ